MGLLPTMTFTDTTFRGIQGFASRMDDHVLLELWAKNIGFVFDDRAMQRDVRRAWGDRGSTGSREFLATALAARFAMRVEFEVSDKSGARVPAPPVSVPFTTLYPVRTGGWPGWDWVETDLLPFSSIFAQSLNELDAFDLGSEWLLSGGHRQRVTSDLDVNPTEYAYSLGQPVRLPDSGIDTVRAVIRIVDLGPTGAEEEVVATFEREWRHTFEEAQLHTRVALTAR